MQKTIEEIKSKIIFNKWIPSTTKGKGAGGFTLEKFFKSEKDNFEVPDYKGIELKTKYSEKQTHIALFSATPDSYLFEIKRLQQTYGYKDKDLPQFKVLNLSVYGNKRVRVGVCHFRLYVDWLGQKVILRVFDPNGQVIDELTSWSFSLLKEKLERKITHLALIHAERKYEFPTVYFKYTNIDFYRLISFEQFLYLIEKGYIRVTFRIGVFKNGKRYGEIYDHGTNFSIDDADIPKLFRKIG